jgi:cytochrome P450
LGSSLARLEVRLSLEEMTQRVKSIRIPEGKDVEYVSSSFTRGLSKFPAILEPR